MSSSTTARQGVAKAVHETPSLLFPCSYLCPGQSAPHSYHTFKILLSHSEILEVSQRNPVFSASFINDRGSSCVIIFLYYLLFIKAHPAQVPPLGSLPLSPSLQGPMCSHGLSVCGPHQSVHNCDNCPLS